MKWDECSLSVYSLPESHHHCLLGNYEYEKQTHVDAVRDFVERMRGGEAPHLIITGPPGCGKTHLSVSLYRAAVLTYGTGECRWFDYAKLVDEAFASMSDRTLGDLWDYIRDASRLFVLDDLFSTAPKKWELENVIFRVITAVETTGAALVVTSNYDKEDIVRHLSAHDASRLLSNAKILQCSGRDRR